MAAIGHGKKPIVERILEPAEAVKKIQGLTRIPVRSQIANEIIGISYGFFSPVDGFMNKADVDSVVKKMRLANGSSGAFQSFSTCRTPKSPSMA